jgi:hypothetical protein
MSVREWGKVPSAFWSMPAIARMSDDGLVLLLYLMTCGHGTIAGVYRLPDGYIQEDLGVKWPAERVAKGFEELLNNGFAYRCKSTKWVWVVKHLEWNRPENPNQRKAAIKMALSVPPECIWRTEFMRRAGPDLGISADELAPQAGSGELFSNPSERVSTVVVAETVAVAVAVTGAVTGAATDQGAKAPLSAPASPTPAPDNLRASTGKPVQAPVQQQPSTMPAALIPDCGSLISDSRDTEAHASVVSAESPSLPACPHRRLLELFRQIVPELPKPRVELWESSAAADAMRQRWKWFLTARREDSGERYATTAAEAEACFERFFSKVHESDFLTGRNGAWTACNLAWLMKRENFAKVIESQYDNDRRKRAAA